MGKNVNVTMLKICFDPRDRIIQYSDPSLACAASPKTDPSLQSCRGPINARAGQLLLFRIGDRFHRRVDVTPEYRPVSNQQNALTDAAQKL